MTNFLSFGNSRPGVESPGEAAAMESLFKIGSREYRRRRMNLRRKVFSRATESMRVHMMIELLPGYSVGAPEMTDILRACCGRYFAYALSDSHDKTIICQLADARGRSVGDVVASFQPLRRKSG